MAGEDMIAAGTADQADERRERGMTEGQMLFAMEDARTQAVARFELMRFMDQQAMQLLGYYSAISVAAAGAALSSFSADPLVPPPAAIGLTVVAAILIAGSYRCLRVMQSATIVLPGDDPGFWLAALHKKPAEEDILDRYLNRCEEGAEINVALNRVSAKHLKRAKEAGVWAPALGGLTGIGAAILPLLQ